MMDRFAFYAFQSMGVLVYFFTGAVGLLMGLPWVMEQWGMAGAIVAVVLTPFFLLFASLVLLVSEANWFPALGLLGSVCLGWSFFFLAGQFVLQNSDRAFD